MLYLKRNSFLLIFILTSMGCATSYYKVGATEGLRSEVYVTPDRIITYCEPASDVEDQGFAFFIGVLDDAKTVLTVFQTNKLDERSCLTRVKDIGKLVSKGREIYLAGMGSLNRPRIVENITYRFPYHGTFLANGRALTFEAITNEKGDCYSPHHADEKPCPPPPFPIRDYP